MLALADAACSSPYAGSSARDRPARSASTSPAIQPRPGVVSYSRPRLAISCMPTQMPRNGRPLRRTASVKRLDHAGHARRGRARQSANAPTPGSTMRSAARDRVGIGGDDDRPRRAPASRAARSKALRGRVQVARAVIDDGDAHRARSASGNRPDHRLARAIGRRTAARRAGAAGPAARRVGEPAGERLGLGLVAIGGA